MTRRRLHSLPSSTKGSDLTRPPSTTFNDLSADTRFEIFSYLFPKAFKPSRVDVVTHNKGTSAMYNWLWTSIYGASYRDYKEDVEEFNTVVAMLGVNKKLREELELRLSELMTFDTGDAYYGNGAMSKLMTQTNETQLHLLQRIKIQASLLIESLLHNLILLPNLKVVIVYRCNASFDASENGTVWHNIHLQCLLKIRQVCPYLTDTECWPRTSGKWSTTLCF